MNLFRRIYVLIIFNFRLFSDSLVQKMPIKGLKNTGKLDFRQEIYPRRGPGRFTHYRSTRIANHRKFQNFRIKPVRLNSGFNMK